jgi:hypothetical protein
MKHIQVVAYCDGLTHEAERVRSTIERTISVDGSGDIVLDLCEQCDQQVQAMQALMERGSKADEPTRRAARPQRPGSHRTPGEKSREPGGMPSTCPDCLHHTPTRSALGQHVKKKHGKQLKSFTDQQYVRAEEEYQQQLVQSA